MTTLFDGMAGVLNGVFGAPLTLYPGGGGPRPVRGVLRFQSVELETDEGFEVVSGAPVLKLQKPDAVGLEEGDQVRAGADVYRVRLRFPTTSVAADGFETFALWRDDP